MAVGKKTGGRDFKPGESGNLGGRPAEPDDVKSIRESSKLAVERILGELLLLPADKVRSRLKNRAISSLEAMICSVILGAIRTGDYRRIDFLLTRLIGKPVIDDGTVREALPDPESAEFPPGYINRILVRAIADSGINEDTNAV